MALQPCRECGREVSTEAATCPHCGTPRPTAAAPNSPTARTPAPAPPPPRVREVAGNAAGWLVGVVLALTALGILTTDLLGGFLFLVAAGVVLPPVNAWLKDKVGLTIPAKARAWIVLVLVVGAVVAIGVNATQEEARETAQASEARAEAVRADFTANGAAIRQRMDSALKARNYALAVSIGQRYVTAGVRDPQLAKLYTDAQAGQRREANRAREQELLARAQVLPASNLEGNRDVYRELVSLNPSNASYKAKLDDYTNRLQQQQAAAQDRIRRFGPMPEGSAWHGTYRVVRDYLRQVVNDPDRLKMEACTSVYHVAEGWLVGCHYRGANAFGGIVRQSNWFIIRQGHVVAMKDASEYRW